MTSICVTLRQRSAASALELAPVCGSLGADMVEIRLDHQDRIEWDKSHQGRLEALGLQSVLTLRSERDGGLFSGGDDAASKVMTHILDSGPDLIDVELGMSPHLRDPLVERARSSGVEVIISHHDHSSTPSLDHMRAIVDRCARAGADIIKAAFMTRSAEDSRAILELACTAHDEGMRCSIMGMGPFGHITRILAPLSGSEIVYCSMDDTSAVDQLDIRTLKGFWSMLRRDGYGP